MSLRNGLYEKPAADPTATDWARAGALFAKFKMKYGSKLPKVSVAEVKDHLKFNRREAHTLANPQQMENVQYCVETALRDGVEGDLIETGVFRGGQTILMRGILKAYGVTDRRVFVADSFEGLPVPKAEVSDIIAHDFLSLVHHFKVTSEEVRTNFANYGLLDDQVCFLKGWFADTLPTAPIEKLAVMRLDGDYYESTMDALNHLYPKLSPGGFAIIDDYGQPVGCRQAVTEYRQRHSISEPIQDVEGLTVFWRRAV
jgi:O-methyltransferase